VAQRSNAVVTPQVLNRNNTFAMIRCLSLSCSSLPRGSTPGGSIASLSSATGLPARDTTAPASATRAPSTPCLISSSNSSCVCVYGTVYAVFNFILKFILCVCVKRMYIYIYIYRHAHTHIYSNCIRGGGRHTTWSCQKKSGNLGDTGISKIRAPRHPSGGPAGHAIAFETRRSLSQRQKGVGKTGGWGILKTRALKIYKHLLVKDRDTGLCFRICPSQNLQLIQHPLLICARRMREGGGGGGGGGIRGR